MSLELVHAFGIATLVGPPSLNRRRFGVPIGGPFDRESATLLRSLLGLPYEAQIWELGMANATFRTAEPGMVGFVGAPVQVFVDDVPLASQAAHPVRAGATVRVLPPSQGARAYVGFRAGLGSTRRLAESPGSLARAPIRVVPGPQAELLAPRALAGTAFHVHPATNRVGVRLQETLPEHAFELPSEPACVGAVQVTGGGQVIVLGPDGPTIGGYPKIAVVADADLDRIGQLRPGDLLTFQSITHEEARAASRAARAQIERWCAEIRAAHGV